MNNEHTKIEGEKCEVKDVKDEWKALYSFRNYSWYMLTFLIYLFCVGIGFVLAYFMVRVLVIVH